MDSIELKLANEQIVRLQARLDRAYEEICFLKVIQQAAVACRDNGHGDDFIALTEALETYAEVYPNVAKCADKIKTYLKDNG